MTKRTLTRPAHTGMCILMLLAACSEVGTVRNDVGAVHFNVELADGSELIELVFRIDGNGIPPIEGVIPAAEAGATLSAAVGELPPGTGYTLSLTGTSSSGQACSGHATFDILANETTTLTVALRCGAAQREAGSLQFEAVISECPAITELVATPSTAPAGGSIRLRTAGPTDVDAEFAWQAEAGSFDPPGDAATVYTCPETAGTQLLSVHMTTSDGCSDTASIQVRCNAVGACGNGEQDPGETCDDGNTANGDGCSEDCRIEQQQACGDGELQGDEACDDGNTVSGDGCSEDCQIEQSACRTCEEERCAEVEDENTFEMVDLAAQCFEMDGQDDNGTPRAQLCEAVLACERSAGCLKEDGAAFECYCGSLPIDQCILPTSSPDGPCVAEIAAAAESDDPQEVGRLFVDPSVALGAAHQLMAQCDAQQDLCRDACF